MTSPARVLPLRSPLARTEVKRTPLRIVPPRRSSAAKTPFAVVLVALLAGGLLGLLMLNTLVAQQSFGLHELATQDKELAQREQELTARVQAKQAPSALAAQATQLGMVPGGAPGFLRLADGKVLGAPQPGVAPVVPKPPASSTTWTGPKPTTKTATAKPGVTTGTTTPSTTKTTTTKKPVTGAPR